MPPDGSFGFPTGFPAGARHSRGAEHSRSRRSRAMGCSAPPPSNCPGFFSWPREGFRYWQSPPEYRQCKAADRAGSASEHPLRLGQNAVAQRGLQRGFLDDFDFVIEPVADQIADADEIEQVEISGGIDFDEHVDVAVRLRLAADERAEQGERGNAAPPQLRFERLQRGCDPILVRRGAAAGFARFRAVSRSRICRSASRTTSLASLDEPVATLRRTYSSRAGGSDTFIRAAAP